MLDEECSVLVTLTRVGALFQVIEIVQSGLQPYPAVAEKAANHPACSYVQLPNFDDRSEEEKKRPGERFDVGARSQARNFSEGFRRIQERINAGAEIDYAVGIHGDTCILHLDGVTEIIRHMKHEGADIGVSRAMGQRFHAATLTREQMADPQHPKEGRLQDHTVKDFMPQFFVAKVNLVPRLGRIKVTNPWCMEQCMGDAIGGAGQFVFSTTAYGYSNGIVYHVPSPLGWKH